MSLSTLLTTHLLIVSVLSSGGFSSCKGRTVGGAGNRQEQNTGGSRRIAAREREKNMDTQFEAVVVSTGQTYLSAERELLKGGQPALATLHRNLRHSDPMTQFIANTLLNWMQGGGQEIEAALSYLDNLPKRLAPTPIPTPSPLGVASFLEKHFGPRVTDALALRLVKQTDWPHWRVMGVLFYLMNQRVASTTPALVRFAAETENEEWRKAAIDALKAITDPNLRDKIAAERQRFLRLSKEFPTELADLEAP